MANYPLLFSLFLISVTNCEKNLPNVGNVGGLFDTIKDGGMIDKFAEKFAELLADKKTVESDSSNEKNNFDLYEFSKEYSLDKFKKYNEKALFYLSKIEVNLNDHLSIVKLTSVLDSLGALGKTNEKTHENKVLEIIKQSKNLQVLKVSLDKLLVETQNLPSKISENHQNQKPRVKIERKPSKSMENMSSTFDPRKRMKNLPAELGQFIEQIREDPSWLVDFATSTLSNYEIVSDKTVQMVEMYANLFTQTEYFQYFLDMALDFLEDLSKSELVRKVFAVIPGLLEAEDLEELVGVIDNGLDLNMNSFVDLVDQYGMHEYLSDFVAAFLQAAMKAVHETINDNMRMTMVNTFLLTQDLPALNARKFTKSFLKILSKLSTYFTSWKVDAKKLEKLVNDFVFEFEKNYIQIDKLMQQDDHQQLKQISKFIQESVAGPLKLILRVHGHIFKKDLDSKVCAPNLLCNLNRHVKSTYPRLNSIILTRFSLLAAWGWSFDEALHYIDLHKAVFKGLKQEDCDVLYKNIPECVIFPWQKPIPTHTEL